MIDDGMNDLWRHVRNGSSRVGRQRMKHSPKDSIEYLKSSPCPSK